MEQRNLFSLIDDYFPDYQFGREEIILLNDSFAQGSGLAAFFVVFFRNQGLENVVSKSLNTYTIGWK